MNDKTTHDSSESSDPTEQIPHTDTTQQLPVQDEGMQASPESAVFGDPAEREDPAVDAAAWPPPVPPRPTGPHAPAIILGLVALAVAGIVLAQELGNLTVDWGDVGPLGFVAIGAVLVVLGAVGLISSNRRHSHS